MKKHERVPFLFKQSLRSLTSGQSCVFGPLEHQGSGAHLLTRSLAGVSFFTFYSINFIAGCSENLNNFCFFTFLCSKKVFQKHFTQSCSSLFVVVVIVVQVSFLFIFVSVSDVLLFNNELCHLMTYLYFAPVFTSKYLIRAISTTVLKKKL